MTDADVPVSREQQTNNTDSAIRELSNFIDDCCIVREEAEVPRKALYDAYRHWAEESGREVCSSILFGIALRELGFRKKARYAGVVRLGLELMHSSSVTSDSARQTASQEWISAVSQDTCGEYEALGPYVDDSTRTRVLHTGCGYEYNVSPHDWHCGSRCWRCRKSDTDPSDDEWSKEVLADIDQYTALNSAKRLGRKRLVQHDHCQSTFFVTPEEWRQGVRCYTCPPIQGRMHKTRKWRREVSDTTLGEYRALGDYISADEMIRVIHIECGFEWNVRPGNWRARKSRCPRCADPRSDNDAVYVWKTPHLNKDGKLLVKVGTTSWRLGHRRIKAVAAKHDIKSDILLFTRVAPGTAVEVETLALRIGEPLNYSSRIDGSTEFRLVTDEELRRIVQLVESARED